jgi:hypothetical protein
MSENHDQSSSEARGRHAKTEHGSQASSEVALLLVGMRRTARGGGSPVEDKESSRSHSRPRRRRRAALRRIASVSVPRNVSPLWLLLVTFLALALIAFFAIAAFADYATAITAATAILNQSVVTILVAMLQRRNSAL